ncbi:MAG: M48 family metallopeptidase [Betaproteobacteria bacterium]|nr:M48 family metallopeptidase [Betaproteobacteria bacterium]
MPVMRQLALDFPPAQGDFAPPHADAPRPATAGTLRRLQLPGGELRYRFVRARRRSIGLCVDAGLLEARAPRYTPIAEVEAFIRQKARWIGRRLAEYRKRPPPLRWENGVSLPLLGRTVTLGAEDRAGGVDLSGDRLILPASEPAERRTLAIAWLRSRALEMFRERLTHFAAALGLHPPSLALSNSKTQWGSCHPNSRYGSRVLLNWRLYLLPPHLVDYVVVHELAHLKELNHSARFWAVVARAVPDHRQARRELNRLGRLLPDL